MRAEGLEPPCLAAPDPKSGTSTNFATPALPAIAPFRGEGGFSCSPNIAPFRGEGGFFIYHLLPFRGEGGGINLPSLPKRIKVAVLSKNFNLHQFQPTFRVLFTRHSPVLAVAWKPAFALDGLWRVKRDAKVISSFKKQREDFLKT